MCTQEFLCGHILADVTVFSKHWTQSRVVLCSTILAVKLLQLVLAWLVCFLVYPVNRYCSSISCLALASATLQRLAAFSRVRSDNSQSNLSLRRVIYTKYNSISNQLSCWAPNSHDFMRVFTLVINLSINLPSCCLYSQNLYLSNTVFLLGLK